mgnify:CR=1 FL=1
MKCPFRFTSTYIADLDQIMSAEVTCNQTEIALLFKHDSMETVDFDSKKQCLATFEEFCKVCAEYAQQQQRTEASK